MILLAVFFGTVGVAYWLVHVRSVVPARRGREMIEKLRGAGLDAHWPDARVVARYERYSGEMPTGDRLVELRSREGGEFIGRTQQYVEGKTAEEQWRLRPDLSEGRYRATDDIKDPTAGRTEIVLSDGRVEVTQVTLFDRMTGSADAPPNYIPEGAMDLVARLVAEDGRPAAFRMILNSAAFDAVPREEPPRQRDGRRDAEMREARLNFSHVLMKPLGERRVRVEINSGLGATAHAMTFNERGEVVEFSYVGDKTVFRLTERKTTPAGGAATRPAGDSSPEAP